MSYKTIKFGTVVTLLLVGACAQAATSWSSQDYDLYSGDFNGDGKIDLLYVAKDSSRASGIALSDGTAPNIGWQSWPSDYLGIQWYGGQYVAVVGDFNNDGRADLLMQRSTPGDSYLLLANADGRFTSIAQTIGNNQAGLTWSRDQHTILPGDFSGDGRDDLFFQAAARSGVDAVGLPDGGGLFTGGPTQTFTDSSWAAFRWSRQDAVITVGDFNGDGRADLLVQAKPSIAIMDFDIPIPIPVYAAKGFGVVYSQGGATPLQQAGVQLWDRFANGVDWSPASAVPIVADFDGDGRDDVLLQATRPGGTSYLLTGNAGGPAFAPPIAVTSNVAISADGAKLIAGRFGGPGAGLYIQATTANGTNYVASAVGSAVSAAEQSTQLAPAPIKVTYGYDARGRLIRVISSGSAGSVQTDYTYDRANNRTSVVTTGSSNPAPKG